MSFATSKDAIIRLNGNVGQDTRRRSLLCMFVLQVLLWMPVLETHAAIRNLKGSSRGDYSRRSVRMIGHQRMFYGKGKKGKGEGGLYGVGTGDPSYSGTGDSALTGNDAVEVMVDEEENTSNGDEGGSGSDKGSVQVGNEGDKDDSGGGDDGPPADASGEMNPENGSDNANESSAGPPIDGDIGAEDEGADSANESGVESSTVGDNDIGDEETSNVSDNGVVPPLEGDGDNQGTDNASENDVGSGVDNAVVEEEGTNDAAENSVFAASAVQCNGVDYDHLFNTTWTYSLVIESDIPRETARLNLEEALLKELTNSEWQGCTQQGSSRKLTDNSINVVAVDREPDDIFMEGKTCAQDEDNCFILTGWMSTYVMESDLEYNAQEALVHREVRTLVRDWMNGGNMEAEGVVRATYLAPNLDDPSSLERSSLPTKVGGESNTLTPGLSVLVALGAFSVVIFCITYAYRWRRDDKLGNATVVTGSEITTSGSNLSASTTGVATSPFSGMLPNAYRLDREMNMSAILEGDSDSASQGVRSDIIISESGFTTDDECSVSHNSTDPESLTHAYLQSLSKTPVLGAQPMYDEDDEDDLLFDTGAGGESSEVQ